MDFPQQLQQMSCESCQSWAVTSQWDSRLGTWWHCIQCRWEDPCARTHCWTSARGLWQFLQPSTLWECTLGIIPQHFLTNPFNLIHTGCHLWWTNVQVAFTWLHYSYTASQLIPPFPFWGSNPNLISSLSPYPLQYAPFSAAPLRRPNPRLYLVRTSLMWTFPWWFPCHFLCPSTDAKCSCDFLASAVHWCLWQSVLDNSKLFSWEAGTNSEPVYVSNLNCFFTCALITWSFFTTIFDNTTLVLFDLSGALKYS